VDFRSGFLPIYQNQIQGLFKDFQGPYEGYISEGARIKAPKAPRGWGSWPTTHSWHISGPQKPSTRSNARRFRKSNSSTFKDLQTQIRGLSIDHVCFQGLSRPWKSGKNSRTFKDPQKPCSLYCQFLLTSLILLGKNHDNAFQFSKVIRQNTVVSFPATVRDNVFLMTSRITVTSSLRYLRSDVVILGLNFLFSQQNESSGWFMPKIKKLCLHSIHFHHQQKQSDRSNLFIIKQSHNLLNPPVSRVFLHLRMSSRGVKLPPTCISSFVAPMLKIPTAIPMFSRSNFQWC